MSRFYAGSASTTTSLSPTATVTATKNASNPTFTTNSLVEDPIKVGLTYYMPYILPAQDTIYLATASNLAGPWSAGSAIWHLTDISWRGSRTILSAPFLYLNPDDGKYDLFYDIRLSDSTTGCIGFASSTTITGGYSDHGSAIVSNGGVGTWDEACAAEPSVVKVGSTWYMAYMGASAAPISTTEKIGFASATTVSGPWTKAAGNPIPYGAGGTWNEALMADPHLFYENGYFWLWVLGSSASPTYLGKEGLYYTTTPTTVASWTQQPSNPILVPTASTWDSARVFRGGILVENGVVAGTYTGGSDISVLTTYKGGNFTLNLS